MLSLALTAGPMLTPQNVSTCTVGGDTRTDCAGVGVLPAGPRRVAAQSDEENTNVAGGGQKRTTVRIFVFRPHEQDDAWEMLVRERSVGPNGPEFAVIEGEKTLMESMEAAKQAAASEVVEILFPHLAGDEKEKRGQEVEENLELVFRERWVPQWERWKKPKVGEVVGNVGEGMAADPPSDEFKEPERRFYPYDPDRRGEFFGSVLGEDNDFIQRQSRRYDL